MEFNVASKPELTFRFKKISPVKLLAMQSIVDFNDFEKSEKLYSFILENTEVNVSGTWLNVKEKGRDVYFPQGIESEMQVLMDIAVQFVKDVITPVFQKSKR